MGEWGNGQKQHHEITRYSTRTRHCEYMYGICRAAAWTGRRCSTYASVYKVNGGIDWSRLRGLWVIRQMSDEVHELCCEYIYGGGLVGHLCLSPDFAKKRACQKTSFLILLQTQEL